MSTPSSIDPYSAPSDYAALFSDYMDTIRRVVSRAGITPDNVDDVSAEILVKFISKGGLSNYTPVYGGRKVRFSTYLIGGVLQYVRHHRDVQTRNTRREGTEIQPHHEKAFEVPEFHRVEVLVDAEHLKVLDTIASTNYGRLDGKQFATLLVKHVQTYGELRRDLLAKEFGVSVAAVGYWVRKAREVLTEAGYAPPAALVA